MKKRDIQIGETYNGVLVLSESDRERYYVVKCPTCGRIHEERRDRIGKSPRCIKCTGRGRLVDLTGRRFGRLTVIGLAPRATATMWHCLCDCGKEVVVSSQHLRNGEHISCGCCRASIDSPGATKRRKSYTDLSLNSGQTIIKHPLYACWMSIKARCYNKNCAEYKNYGGRGISMCDRWSGRNGFENFVRDMEPRPTGAYSIDRLDVNKGYSPENCRWATQKQQGRNMRKTIYLYLGEQRIALQDFCEKHGLNPKSFYKRLKKGYDINFILSHINDDFGKRPICRMKNNYINFNKIINIQEYEH